MAAPFTSFSKEVIMARKRSAERETSERAAEQMQSAASSAGDLWIESQARTLDHIDDVMNRWMDAARHSLEEMRECSTLGELMRVQQEWIVGSMRRTATDMAQFGKMTMDMAQRATSQIERTTARTADEVERASQEFASAAGSKPQIEAVE
jgi:phasin protein